MDWSMTYTVNVWKRFRMSDEKSVSTPVDVNLNETSERM